MNWKKVEQEALSYLQEKLPKETITLQGGSNSNTSDILINNCTNVEVKMAKSQCAQFTILDENKFILSKKAQTEATAEIIKILEKINQEYESIKQSGTKGISLHINSSIIEKHISNHYKIKNTNYIMINKERNFFLINIKDIGKIFNFKLKVRSKKSGSRSLSQKSKYDFLSLLKKAFPDASMSKEKNKFFVNNIHLNKSYHLSDIFIISKKNNLYEARIKANTAKNLTVIVELELKNNFPLEILLDPQVLLSNIN